MGWDEGFENIGGAITLLSARLTIKFIGNPFLVS
jgi:hypothetical protein